MHPSEIAAKASVVMSEHINGYAVRILVIFPKEALHYKILLYLKARSAKAIKCIKTVPDQETRNGRCLIDVLIKLSLRGSLMR
ncbi:MAG: hypothetical protein RL326_1789 [Pseudomonadota bacterium]|jgi:hypothetical protein